MGDPTQQLDDYWQARGEFRAEERARIRNQYSASDEMLRLFALLDQLEAVREMIVREGSQAIRSPETDP